MPLFGGGGGSSPFATSADVINKVTASNQVRLGPTGSDEYQLRLLRGAAGTTANIFEVYNETEGAILARITGVGNAVFANSVLTTDVGISRLTSGAVRLGLSSLGGVVAALDGNIRVTTAMHLLWGGVNSAGTETVPDLGIERSAAGILEVTDGSTGQGRILIGQGSLASPSLQIINSTIGLWSNQSGDGGVGIVISGADTVKFRAGANLMPAAALWGWSAVATLSNTFDVAIGRSAAAVLAIYGASASVGGNLALASDMAIRFSSTTDPDAAADAGIARDAAGFLRVTDGSSGDGGIRVADGTVTAPSLAFDNESGTGFFLRGALSIDLAINGAAYLEVSLPGSIPCFRVQATSVIGWVPGTDVTVSNDTMLGRSAAGVVGLYGAQDRSTGSSLVLASDKLISFSSTTDPDGTTDLILSRAAANVLRLGLTTDIDALHCSTVVEASTAGSGAPNLLDNGECRKLITNEGATAEAYNTLPTAVAGLEYEFYCDDADGIRITASAGDTIQVEGTLSATAGFIKSVVIGSAIRLKAINGTEWVAVAITGTWTIDA